MEGWLRQDAVVCSDKHQPTKASMTQCSSQSSQIQTVTKASAVNLLAPHSSKRSVNTSCSDPNMAILNVVESVSCDNKLPGEKNRKHDQLVKPGRKFDLSTQLPCQPELTGQSDDDLMYSSRELVRWDPCMSPIQGSDSFRIPFIESITMESSFDESLQDMSLPCQPNCTMVTEEQKIVTSYSSRSVHIDRLLVNSVSIGSVMAEQSWLPRQPNCTLATIATDTESDRSEAEDWEGSRLRKLDWEQGMTSADGRGSRSLRCSTPEPTSSRFNFTDNSEANLERKLAIHDVVNCEDGYITQMQCGIQRFSRPLRHCIGSSMQHATLFQNVEKLVVISQYHLSQLLDLSDHIEISRLDNSVISTTQDVFTDNIAAVYVTNVVMLCAAYDSYQRGLAQALQLLRQLTELPDFARFLQVSSPESGQLDIEEFLKQPVRHFKELLSHLKRVHHYTSPEHSGYNNMKEVIQALQETLKPTNNVLLLENVTSLESRPCHQSRDSLQTPSCVSTNVRSKSKSLSSLGSLDSDVVELQNNLTFTQGVKHFQVAAPNRHLIFSGDLLWVHDTTCWPVWVLLLSDMLLLTRRGTGSHLVVVEEPLNLCNIVKTQFNLDHPSEFALCCAAENSLQTDNKTYVLRALNMEQKCTWKTILEHRRNTCQQSREKPLQSMNANIFI
ncbi:hypothetical protein LSAT2_021997 [Lamellibrachia satsuma]|nr:hypothetical protein LSAT2_021997 [Lamellibrachia satsuma]